MPKDNSTKTKARRRSDAEARQSEYDALDAEGKLNRLNRNLGVTKPEGARKERARLEKLAGKGE